MKIDEILAKADGVIERGWPATPDNIEDLAAAVRTLRKRLTKAKKVVKEADLFERAATAEMNEKGAGGYALARLSDLRSALKAWRKEN